MPTHRSLTVPKQSRDNKEPPVFGVRERLRAIATAKALKHAQRANRQRPNLNITDYAPGQAERVQKHEYRSNKAMKQYYKLGGF